MNLNINTRTIIIAILLLCGVAFFALKGCNKDEAPDYKATITNMQDSISVITDRLQTYKINNAALIRQLEQRPVKIEPRVITKTKIVEVPIYKIQPDPETEREVLLLQKELTTLLQAAKDNEQFYIKQEETIAAQSDALEKYAALSKFSHIKFFKQQNKKVTLTGSIRGEMIGEPLITLSDIASNQITAKETNKDFSNWISAGALQFADNIEPIYNIGLGFHLNKRLSVEFDFLSDYQFSQTGLRAGINYHFNFKR